ncbi:MAG: hypothetical protein ABUS51_08140 [Acidobacteriota bacterium]
MYIEDLYQRLLESARQRIRAGEVSERGLARLCNISQPHMHNVLKSIRTLSPASADRLMRGLNLTVPELLWRYPGEIEAGIKAVPVVRSRIGPGGDAVLSAFRGYTPVPLSLVRGLMDPVAARLSPDLLMPTVVFPNDLVLLDQNPAVRENPGVRGCWVVAEKAGLRVRYIQVCPADAGTRLYVACEAAAHEQRVWQPVPLQGRTILDIVRARIVWIGREMEKEQAGPAGPPGPGD